MTALDQEKEAEIVTLRNRIYAARDKLDLARRVLKRAEDKRNILAAHDRSTVLAEKRIIILKKIELEAHSELDKIVALLCKAEEIFKPKFSGKHGRDICRTNNWGHDL
jgi:hypothetical protein